MTIYVRILLNQHSASIGLDFGLHESDIIMSAMVSQITNLTIVYSLNRLFRRRSKETSKLYVNGLCEGNSPVTVTGEFPAQRPVTRSFDVFFALRLNKRLSKQSWGLWFETLSWSLWRHCNGHRWFKTKAKSIQCLVFFIMSSKKNVDINQPDRDFVQAKLKMLLCASTSLSQPPADTRDRHEPDP